MEAKEAELVEALRIQQERSQELIQLYKLHAEIEERKNELESKVAATSTELEAVRLRRAEEQAKYDALLADKDRQLTEEELKHRTGFVHNCSILMSLQSSKNLCHNLTQENDPCNSNCKNINKNVTTYRNHSMRSQRNALKRKRRTIAHGNDRIHDSCVTYILQQRII